MQPVMAELPIDLHIGDVEETFKCAAFKGKTEPVPDWTSGAVTANKILSFYDVRCSAAVFDVGSDACLILRKAFECGLPENILSATLHILVHELLVLALLQNQHVRVRTQPLADIRQINLADNRSAFEHADFPG